MNSKRALCWLMVLLAGTMPLAAQVSVDQYLNDGSRYVCSQQEVMYDNYFHAAQFAIAANVNASGLMTFTLEVTYDEGMLHITQGDSLVLVLRGGDRIVLKTIHDVTRADIQKRHFLTHNNYYVTCRYSMSTHDVQRISRNRVTKISVQTDDFSFDRKLDKFQDRFRRLFNNLYRHLMGNNR